MVKATLKATSSLPLERDVTIVKKDPGL